MRRSAMTLFLSAAVLVVSAAAAEKERTLRFGKADLGRAPAGWTVDRTGKGEGSVWKVVADATAPSGGGVALAQTAESPDKMFNLCVFDDGRWKDVELRVAFKAVRGKLDQGGGLVWRYRDADNYYVARMNPLEDNLRLYKVVDGKRTQLETKEELKVPANEWHTLGVAMKGDRIEVRLDGKKYLEAADTTFPTAGKVGLWSKADAQTYFDDFRVSVP